jgi:acyl-coenzyme A thioesterase PaaI-like protein
VCGLENPYGLHLRFYDTGPGEVTVECILPEEYQGYPDVVHGGIVAAILDEAAGRSLMNGDPPRFMFTAKLDIRYRKNVPTEQLLRVVGRAGANKRRTATATSAIYNGDGELLAEASAVLINVPQEVVEEVDMEALGWKIYDEE